MRRRLFFITAGFSEREKQSYSQLYSRYEYSFNCIWCSKFSRYREIIKITDFGPYTTYENADVKEGIVDQLALQLPRALRRRLARLTRNRKISLGRCVICTLAHRTTLTPTVRIIPRPRIRQRRRTFRSLVGRLKRTSSARLRSILTSHRRARPRTSLDTSIVSHLGRGVRANQGGLSQN